MTSFRTALTVAVLGLLAAGYAASQAAFFQGRADRYAAAVDQQPIRMLALVVLILAVILFVVRDPEVPER